MKVVFANLLMSVLLVSIIGCAAGNQELVKEKDEQLLKLRKDLEVLDEKLQVEKHQIEL
ncbi:MAG: hypothetical protein HQ508_00455 [Candidatus Marinimicrobia bacterium]|nr:hypothetical protein [Candidatus Neomarinimicrobiota bacterium]